MKKAISLLLSIILIFSAMTAFGFTAAAESGKNAEELPSSVDLRNYNGMNYVTPVKNQGPFGTCWAFAVMAAAEVSYLYENGLGVPAGEINDNIDFSEKQLVYNVTRLLTESDVKTGYIRASQVGEGMDVSEFDETNKNAHYDLGGDSLYSIAVFGSGLGPVSEDTVINGDTPFYYSGKNRWRINGIGATEEIAELRKEYLREQYRMYKLEELLKDGSIQSVDEFDEWFDDNWTEGKNIDAKYRARSYYAGYDDWTVPDSPEYRYADIAAVLRCVNMLPVIRKNVDAGVFEFNEAGINAVKSEIANGHAVAIGIMADQSDPGDELTDDSFMNTETWAQYYHGMFIQDHGVTIIGYDDNYSKDNFTLKKDGEVVEGSTPPADGAFIVKNSWGAVTEEDKATAIETEQGNIYESPNADNWGIDDTGYFYISYYDTGISRPLSFSFYTDDDKAVRDLRFDQYDTTFCDSYSCAEWDSEVKTANIFDAQEDGYLQKISFVSTAEDSTVHYEIYRDPDPNEPDSGELLEEGDVVYRYNGLHRADLKGEYYLKKGERYSIVISERYEKDEAVKYSETYTGSFTQAERLKINTVINPGESLIYSNGAWSDIKDSVKRLVDNEYDLAVDYYGQEVADAILILGKDSIIIDNYPIKGIYLPAAFRDNIRGDADGDDMVTILDATAIQRTLAELYVSRYNETAADADRDGGVTILDATAIQRYLAEMGNPYGIGSAIDKLDEYELPFIKN